MEVRIKGKIIDCINCGDTQKYVLSTSEGTYNICKCNLVPVTREARTNGVRCYRGNIELGGSVINETLATLWIDADNNAECKYRE